MRYGGGGGGTAVNGDVDVAIAVTSAAVEQPASPRASVRPPVRPTMMIRMVCLRNFTLQLMPNAIAPRSISVFPSLATFTRSFGGNSQIFTCGLKRQARLREQVHVLGPETIVQLADMITSLDKM